MTVRDFSALPAWPWIAGPALLVMLATWSPIPDHELPPDTPWRVLMAVDNLTAREGAAGDSLTRLVKQPIRLTGFMYPLEQGRNHRRFLLSPHPAGCSFHPPPGATSLVEVFASETVKFTYDPIAVEGVFDLTTPELGEVSYQIRGARVEKLP